jgi:homoserine dehydrogenase
MKKIKVGLAGLGTVGKGVYDILHKDKIMLQKKTDCDFEIVAVANRSKKNFVSPEIKFYFDILDLAADENIDVVIEAIGGVEIAKDLIFLSLKNNKKVITANKAILAEKNFELQKILLESNSNIYFEASTAGANPVIKNFRESFSSNEITDFFAILNGTCNFILTKMLDEKKNYQETLLEAQNLGYAEADPKLDVAGVDTAHKLSILSSIASNSLINFNKIYVEGIEKIDFCDVEMAFELGYKVKLLATFRKNSDKIFAAVYPSLVKKSEKIAQIDGPFNAVLTNTTNASWNLSVGRGAGGLTTGSAIISDLIDIAKNRSENLFVIDNKNLTEIEILSISERVGKYFILLNLDKNFAENFSLKNLLPENLKINQSLIKEYSDFLSLAILVEENSELEIQKIIENFDKKIVKKAKFIRVEETKF